MKQSEINMLPREKIAEELNKLLDFKKEYKPKESHWTDMKGENAKYWIWFPTDDGMGCEYYKLPLDVYEHKIYPTCTKCQERFVIINENDKECFKCQFLK